MTRGSEETNPVSSLGAVAQASLIWCVLLLCQCKLSIKNQLYLMSQKPDVYRVLDVVEHGGPAPVIMGDIAQHPLLT